MDLYKENIPSLHDIASKYDTDKGYYHFFTIIYDFWLRHLRHSAITMLEIGYAKGGSALMWSEYFSDHNIIHCVDIDPPPEAIPPSVKYWQVDQSQRHLLSQLPRSLDLIVDDGGHTMEQQQVSLAVLLHHLAPAGIYILEDLHTSLEPYEKTHGCSPLNNTINLLSDLMKGHPTPSNQYYISGFEFFHMLSKIHSIDIFKVKEDSITARIITKSL